MRSAAVPAPLLLLAAIATVQVGAVVATGLIGEIGSAATVAIRLAVASAILLPAIRPRLRGRSRRDWASVLVLGLFLGTMNLSFYSAIGRLPLGVVVTIEFLGPLAVAAGASRRPGDLIAVVLALAGVVAVSGVIGTDLGALDLLGLALSVAAGVAWAGYILAMRLVGRRWAELDGLALAMLVAALVVVPLTLGAGWATGVEPRHLVAGLAVGVLSSVIPYSLEFVSLRRIEPRVFGILLSIEPAAAAIAAFLLLGQALTALEIGGIGLVIAASVLVMVRSRGRAAGAPELGELEPG